MEPLLALKEVSFGISSEKILVTKLSFNVMPGSVTFIRGSNGVGKSTLLKVLAGLPGYFCRGDVIFNPALKNLPVYIPQNFDSSLHIPLSLADIISAGCQGRAIGDLDKYGLFSDGDLKKAWQTASGGEKQKTVLVRHLNQGPQILLLDEPTNHLDQNSAKSLWQVLDNFIGNETEQRAALIVIHGEEIPDFKKIKTFTVNMNQNLISD